MTDINERARQETKARGDNSPRLGPYQAEVELATLYAAYKRGKSGCVVVAGRSANRVAVLALPPVRSEEAQYRQMREVAKRLTLLKCDGSVIIRRAIAQIRASERSTEQIRVVLVQGLWREDNHRANSFTAVARLDADATPMFTEYDATNAQQFVDRVAALLFQACGQE